MYDGVLWLVLPDGYQTVGYADDVALVVVAQQPQDGNHLQAGTEVAANERIEIGYPICGVDLGRCHED